MRILLQEKADNFSPPDGTEVVTFFEEGGDIPFHFAQDTFRDILAKLPSGWEPDVVILWVDYHPLPIGIEDSPYPTVARIGDWNLCFDSIRGVAPWFDYIFADRRGVEVFRRAGHPHVDHAPLWGFDPSLHRRIEGVEKTWDISFVGNLNPAVHRERSRWLARIARLSDRYSVRILQGLRGEDYALALNQSKITFNRSIAGAMNMRAYEAPACGSLLFLEEDNLEVRDVYTDRVHCVLYNENNLEELLDYYLAHDDERQRIVEAAHRRVQDFSNGRQFARIVERVRALGIARAQPEPRQQYAPATVATGQARAAQAIQSISLARGQVAERELQAVIALNPKDPIALNNLGALYGMFALRESASPDQRYAWLRAALGPLEVAIALHPAHAVAHANRAEALLGLGDPPAADLELTRALQALPACPADLLRHCIFLPWAYDTFLVEYEKISARFAADGEAFASAARDLYRWRLWARLGDVWAANQNWWAAGHAYGQAVEAAPFGSTRRRLAEALTVVGQVKDAIAQLQLALEDEPFDLPARVSLARLLLAEGDVRACRRTCVEALQLIHACPHYLEHASSFEGLLKELPWYETAAGLGTEPLAASSGPEEIVGAGHW